MANKFITVILWGCLAYTVEKVIAESNSASSFDCNLFETAEAALDGGLSLVKDFITTSNEAQTEFTFDNE